MTVLRSAAKHAVAAFDAVVRRPRGITILAFHRVGARTDSTVDLPLDLFAAQIGALVELHPVVALDEAVALLRTGDRPDGPDPVVVTFDDGTSDFADLALPVLVRHRVPVCLYLATRFVEEQVPFAGAPPLSWAALREAVSTGLVVMGSHTHSHLALDRAQGQEAAEDIGRSIDLIGTHLGAAPRHFAYPRAVEPSAEVAAIVASQFESAALSGCRPNPYGTTDQHRLSRSPVQRADGLRWFRRKAAGGMWLEGSLRAAANRRYGVAR